MTVALGAVIFDHGDAIFALVREAEIDEVVVVLVVKPDAVLGIGQILFQQADIGFENIIFELLPFD